MALPPLSPFQAAGATLALMFAMVASVSLASAGLAGFSGRLVLPGLLEVVLYGGASVWLVRRAPGIRGIARSLGLTRAPAGVLGCALLLGVTLHGPAELLEWLGRQLFPIPEAVLRERAERLSPDGSAERVALAIVVALLAPAVEELFFRGALHARLAVAMRLIGVTTVTTLCFTVSHPEPALWPALASVGVALGLMRALNHGIFPCLLLHAAFNATTLAVAFQGPIEIDVARTPNVAVVCIGTALSVALCWATWRATRREAPEAA